GYELFIHRCLREAQLRVGSWLSNRNLRRGIFRIRVPVNVVLRIPKREPRQATMCTNLVVEKSILPVTPCPESHPGFRIGVDNAVRPAGRDDDLLPRMRQNRDTGSRIVRSSFLGVDDGLAFPDFKDLRSGPAAVRGDRVNVSLTANRFVSQAARRVRDDTEEQHAPP